MKKKKDRNMSELITHSLGSSNIGQNLEKPTASSASGASGYFNIPIVGWALSLLQTPTQLESPEEKVAPTLEDTEFTLVDWTPSDEVTFSVEESFKKEAEGLQEALSFIPFFEDEANITKENISLFINQWNEENPDLKVNPDEGLVEAIHSIKQSSVNLGEQSFIKGVGLYALYSEKALNLAQQVFGHVPKDDNYDQTMINWYVNLRC